MKNGNLYKWLLVCFFVFLIIFLIYKKVINDQQDGQNILEMKEIVHSEVQMQTTQTVETTESQIDLLETSLASEVISTEETETMTYPVHSEGFDESLEAEGYDPYSDLEIRCYFTNTKGTLDQPGAFSWDAHGRLVEDTQRFLDSQKIPAQELRCIDDTLIDDSFLIQCVDDENQVIKIRYLTGPGIWDFEVQ